VDVPVAAGVAPREQDPDSVPDKKQGKREASATSFVRSAVKQVNDQGDHGKKEEQVDEKTRDVVDEESAGPKQK
jgi:hypothetical protein